VCAADAELVEVALEMVGARGERQRAVGLERRSAVVACERGRDDFIASGQLAEHGTPVTPAAGEAVQQQKRLAGAVAIDLRGDLSHDCRPPRR
jgi:hypothetical protein